MVPMAPPSLVQTSPLSYGGVRVLLRADVYRRLGDAGTALALLEAIDPQHLQLNLVEPSLALYTRSHLVRARLYAEQGDRGAAIAAYERFVSSWQSADPSLHAELREARASLQALRDGGVIRPIPGVTP
jgi:tetratricopeptide (TPR) repeat protein